jgi:hypothetical protein
VEDRRAELALDAEGVHISAKVQAGQRVFQHPEAAPPARVESAASGQQGVPLQPAALPAWVASAVPPVKCRRLPAGAPGQLPPFAPLFQLRPGLDSL